MGHLTGKELYRELGRKIDGLTVRAPWNETFYEILKTLYSAEEAEVVVRMPYGLAGLDRIARLTGRREPELKRLLDGLARKGLVMDVCIREQYFYLVSPMVIGIFEFTMMRTDPGLDTPRAARLFADYMSASDAFYQANYDGGQVVSPMRTLPWEEALDDGEFVEVLEYEKARSLIEEHDRFAIGLCSCRHKKAHTEEGACEVPMEKCSSMGPAADYLIRNGMAREVSRSRMLENLDESREMGLVLNADNVRTGCDFICHCCGCCCLCLLGISKHGYPNTLVSSTLMADPDPSTCTGCGRCARACHISIIEMRPEKDPQAKRKKEPAVDGALCLGCGVCALACKSGTMRLVPGTRRVIHPETIFERVILQSLERGTLQNQIFPEPENVTHKFMRGFVGGVLKLGPVKAALMSDMLRSRFLETMAKAAGGHPGGPDH